MSRRVSSDCGVSDPSQMICSDCGTSAAVGCGCSSSSKTHASFAQSCCQSAVQRPPSPCCESHLPAPISGLCLRPTCSVAASEDPFILHFDEDIVDQFPITNDIYLYHEDAKLLSVNSHNGGQYTVSLVDPTLEGAAIEAGDCLLAVYVPGASTGATGIRCLVGNFVVPGLDANSTIFIYNGAGIPIGSTITFANADGILGSYLVAAFVSSSEGVYAYTVTNTGEGHTPTTIIDGGAAGDCTIPIEVNSVVDYCDLSTSETVDTLAGCKNGSPRAFTTVGENFVPVGTAEGTWDQKKIAEFECCVFTDGVLKFDGEACTVAVDTVFLRDVNIDCFDDAFIRAEAVNTILVMSIGTQKFVSVAWDAGTRELQLKPVGDYVPDGESFLEYPEGTQICLGECCDQCTNGPQMTNHNTSGDLGSPVRASTFVYEVELPYDDLDIKHYLVGHNSGGVTVALELDATWNDTLEPGIGRPLHSDPLLFRQKICETSLTGCPQDLELDFNFEMAISNIPANLRVHWEIGSFTGPSATLADDTTPNPYHFIASSAVAAGTYNGPSLAVDTILGGTSVNIGDGINAKVLPFIAGNLRDFATLRHCDCANNIVWCYVVLEPLAAVVAGDANFYLAVRRKMKKFDLHFVVQPINYDILEGFN